MGLGCEFWYGSFVLMFLFYMEVHIGNVHAERADFEIYSELAISNDGAGFSFFFFLLVLRKGPFKM